MNDLWLQFIKWAYEKSLAMLTQPSGGVGIVTDIGSGYSVEVERMENIMKLKLLCDEAVANPSFEPRDGKTFCNFGARFIAEGMGFMGFPANILANEMIGFLATSSGWVEDSIARAHAHAARGGLAFVCLSEYPHGHIAALYPAPMEDSGTWGGPVPMLANVGRKNGVVKMSAVYRLETRPLLRAFLFGEVA